jgi:hypothetical protein
VRVAGRIAVVAMGVAAMSSLVRAQEPSPGRKQAVAVRVESGAIRLDGHLDDDAWRRAPALTDFVQSEPVEGAMPTDSMEVRFVYDDTALYVGARMSSRAAGAIQAPLSRRDDGAQAEYLEVELDTYLDHRTAYMFGVTAAGVRLDHYHPSDNENSADSGFDPVWEARVSTDADGWTAELWVPLSQLRFNEGAVQVWGLNLKRWVPTLNEEVYWVPVLRTERGWASRFGELRGLDDIHPRTRLEVLPYVATSSRVNGSRDRANPFDDGVNLDGRVGADVKLGLGPNLTLDVTVNPDFGQIDADPAEVNLSAFETFFGERRPFFLEGAQLLQGATNNFFYSRRIGARPSGPATGDYVDYPDTATILAAGKLTGRLASGTSVGALAAVTGEEFAQTTTAGSLSRTRVATRTFWGVSRVEQEFGREGSTFGFHATVVHRDLDPSDPLARLQTRNAVTAGADTRIRFADRTYEVALSSGLTYVNGEAPAIERLQRANTHLFQRPDRDEVRLDPTRTSLGGLQIRGAIDKIAGRHWLWGVNQMIESPEFEPNDIGRLNFAGDFMGNGRLQYRETVPGRHLRNYSLQLSSNWTAYYQTDLTPRVSLSANTNLTFNNFWSTSLSVGHNFRGQDAQLTRGGPSMGTPKGWNLNASLRTPGSSTTQWNVGASYRTSETGDEAWGPSFGLSLRPSPSWRLSFNPGYDRERSYRQYVTTLDGNRPETYFKRYVFGFTDRTTISAQVRVNYIVKPDLTLDVYAEPFAASGRYMGYGELESARSQFLRIYGQGGIAAIPQPDGSLIVQDGDAAFTLRNRDFNVRSFRSNVVLRWEWRPGSTLFVVWQQNRSDSETRGDRVGPDDLFGSFSAPGDNIFALKTTVWFSR